MPRLLTWLLLPLSWLYAAVLAGRNWLYDHGWRRATPSPVPLIGVGNLRVGGTGKTPHVAWLIEELLALGHRPAILSRGYGRRTRGPRLAGPADSAATVGDEPWQYYQDFSPRGVPVAVAEKRPLGLALLLEQHPETSVVVLDDAYQHRALRPALNLLLTEYARPFWADHVLPAGRLREARAGAARAHAVLVSKCPAGLGEAEKAAFARQVARYARPGAPVLFSAYAYGPPRPLTPVAPPAPAPGPALLLTGIAQPGPLRAQLESLGFRIQHHAALPDHHAFSPADIAALRAHWQPGHPIFTTTKDATRLQAPALQAALAGLPLYTISVAVALSAADAAELRRLVLAAAPVSSRPL